ncbi:MAG: 1-deoxy-D-xylulose-5-phosphate synthase, partial [Treponema sp.]|nr:1-deoxy-D-xylulose-5-phosphate synthase [Treponema sp.]
TGGMYQESLSAARLILMKNFFADIYTMRFVFPIDEKHFVLLSQKYDAVVLIEDGVERGGASEMLDALLLKNLQNMQNANLKVAKKTFPNAFFSHGSREDVLEEAGMSSSCIASFAISLLEEM